MNIKLLWRVLKWRAKGSLYGERKLPAGDAYNNGSVQALTSRKIWRVCRCEKPGENHANRRPAAQFNSPARADAVGRWKVAQVHAVAAATPDAYFATYHQQGTRWQTISRAQVTQNHERVPRRHGVNMEVRQNAAAAEIVEVHHLKSPGSMNCVELVVEQRGETSTGAASWGSGKSTCWHPRRAMQQWRRKSGGRPWWLALGTAIELEKGLPAGVYGGDWRCASSARSEEA